MRTAFNIIPSIIKFGGIKNRLTVDACRRGGPSRGLLLTGALNNLVVFPVFIQSNFDKPRKRVRYAGTTTWLPLLLILQCTTTATTIITTTTVLLQHNSTISWRSGSPLLQNHAAILRIGRSLGLAVPVILVYAFILSLQTYVLRLDIIVAIIGLVFVGLEGLLSIGTAISFYHAFRG